MGKSFSIKRGDVILFIFDSDKMDDNAFVVFAVFVGRNDPETIPSLAHYKDIEKSLSAKKYQRLCQFDSHDDHHWQKTKALSATSWCALSIQIHVCFRMEVWRKKKGGKK